MINRCNTVLHYAPIVNDIDPNYTLSEMKANIAEVTALRALCYFYLARTFRDVPYVTEPSIDDTHSYAVAATPFEEVLTNCINDLEKVKDDAVRRYARSQDNSARITRYGVCAILADMYLWMNDYDNCIANCDIIIDRKKELYEEERNTIGNNSSLKLYNREFPLIDEQAHGVTSGSAYNDIFGTGNSFESIFELEFVAGQSVKNSFISAHYGYDASAGAAGVGYLSAPENLFKDAYTVNGNDHFKRTDCRYLETMSETAGGIYKITKYVYTNVSFNASTSSTSAAPIVTARGYSSDQNTSNWIIYRLTDIMLLKAEAEVLKAGEVVQGTALSEEQTRHFRSAFTLVGAVYNRANNLTITSSDTLVYGSYATSKGSTQRRSR